MPNIIESRKAVDKNQNYGKVAKDNYSDV